MQDVFQSCIGLSVKVFYRDTEVDGFNNEEAKVVLAYIAYWTPNKHWNIVSLGF